MRRMGTEEREKEKEKAKKNTVRQRCSYPSRGRAVRRVVLNPGGGVGGGGGGGGGDVRMSGRLRDRAADVVLARFSLGEISAQLTALNDRPQDQVNTVTNMVAVLGSPFKRSLLWHVNLLGLEEYSNMNCCKLAKK